MKTEAITTNHAELKRKMLDACIKKHQTVIDDFKKEVEALMGSVDIINEEEMDLSQQGFNAETTQRASSISDQLNFANEEMRLLNNMTPSIDSEHDYVQLGSVVVTDSKIFFISTSIEQFEVDGLKVFGISTQSPLFKEMKGKKKGEIVNFNKDSYKIKDVF